MFKTLSTRAKLTALAICAASILVFASCKWGGDTNPISLATGERSQNTRLYEWPGGSTVLNAPSGFCIAPKYSKVERDEGTLVMHQCPKDADAALLFVTMLPLETAEVSQSLIQENLGKNAKTLSAANVDFIYATQKQTELRERHHGLSNRLRAIGVAGEKLMLVSLYAPSNSRFLGKSGIATIEELVEKAQINR